MIERKFLAHNFGFQAMEFVPILRFDKVRKNMRKVLVLPKDSKEFLNNFPNM